MTNEELADKRDQLREKCHSVAGMSPMLAAGQFKIAAMMMAEITDELTRRELLRENATDYRRADAPRTATGDRHA
ncbi:hypothetical protein BTW10_09985 [Chromohalobacter japonicus]|uniref:Uncharacterized protein n=2 Tax=Chromohalobacter TaxID=42054 RepID=A0A1Q8TCQ0_9GAMM|nr:MULTISPECIES: hypothetical protein [Chromohalobacter]MCK2046992.1 hypothetical protein [Chromohalobacter moromii]MCT8506569.1 hypothetical protein [Chromohalobacter moromii]OLO11408.1 hypothetical protein BTW10_09985 [Chromohalobacter japonicus]